MKHYLLASVFIFVSGIYLGTTSPDWVVQNAKESMAFLQRIADLLQKLPHPQLWFFVFIFLNNLIKSVFFVYSGAAFGLFPIYVLLLNGITLGYLSVMTAEQGHSVWAMVIKGLLPHGIIEIPAIILACAYGIRFGGLVLKTLLFALVPARGRQSGQELMHLLRMTLPLMLVLLAALCVAAVIESTLTYWLVKQT